MAEADPRLAAPTARAASYLPDVSLAVGGVGPTTDGCGASSPLDPHVADSCLRATPAAATRQRLRRPPAHGRSSVRPFPGGRSLASRPPPSRSRRTESHNLTTSQALGRHCRGRGAPHQGVYGHHLAGENAVTAIVARRFSGARLVSTLQETDSPRRPTVGDAQLDGRGRSRLAAPNRRGGQLSPGCEPRSRRSRPDHRRLRRVLGTPGPACGRAVVSEELPMRIIAIDARPPPPACGYQRRISQPPAAVRSVGDSLVVATRTPTERRQARGRLLPACSARGCDPNRDSGDRQPTAGIPSAASPGKRSLASRPLDLSTNPDPDDHERCHQPPRSRMPSTRGRGSEAPALTSHSADVTSTYQPE